MNRKGFWIGLAAAIWLIAALLPVVPLPIYAFMDGGWQWPGLLPESFSLRTFDRVMVPGTFKALLTSVSISFWCVVLNALIAFPAADALGRRHVPLRRGIEAFLLLPALVPPLMVAMGLYRNFLLLGLTGTFGGIVIIHMVPTLPYMIRTLVSAYSNYGFEYEEQARMLGAGPAKRFFHITLPYMMPALGAGAGLTILISMAQYVTTFLIGGGALQTLTLRMMPYLAGGNLGMGSMYTMLFAFAAGILLLAVSKFAGRAYGKEDKD